MNHPHHNPKARRALLSAALGLTLLIQTNTAVAAEPTAYSAGLLKAFAELDAGARAQDQAAAATVESARNIAIAVQENRAAAASVHSQLAYVLDQELIDAASMPLPWPTAGEQHFSKRRAANPVSNQAAWQRRTASDAPTRAGVDRQLKAAFSFGLAKIAACWEHLQLQSGSADGQVVLGLKLNARGTVERVSTLGDNMGNDELNKCILAAALRLKTAGNLGQTVFVELPLNFSVRGGVEHARLD